MNAPVNPDLSRRDFVKLSPRTGAAVLGGLGLPRVMAARSSDKPVGVIGAAVVAPGRRTARAIPWRGRLSRSEIFERQVEAAQNSS